MDGILVIADIGGYTRYLTGVELEHSQDILSDIMGLIAEQLGKALTVEQLEGDAVFCYRPDGERLDLLATIEDCYVAFADRVRSIYRLSTCDCRACRSVPMLDLKFVAHHGTFLEQIVAGKHSLLGSDVILIHRLLKNGVNEATGLGGYAFLSDGCVDHAGIDPAAAELTKHGEDYEDVGHVSGWVWNLEQVWRDRNAGRHVYVSAAEALVCVERKIASAPEVIWDFAAVPFNQVGWVVGLDSVEEHTFGGVRGIGTVTHCVHGDMTMRHEVLDWQPPRYLTERIVGTRTGTWIVTAEVVPDPPQGSLVAWRMRAEALPEGIDEPTLAAAVSAIMQQSYDNALARIAEGAIDLSR